MNGGYVYCPDFITDTDADAEFRAKNPKVTATRIVRFVSGRYERGWVKNVVAVGNASGFVEPLESTALAAICGQAKALAFTLDDSGSEVTPTQVAQYNKRNGRNWDNIRNFLSIHYRFNTRLDTPFWRACRAAVDLCGAAEFVDHYRQNGPSLGWRSTLVDASDQFGMEGSRSLLVGKQVPYRTGYRPSERDLATWAAICRAVRETAEAAFTIPEALAAIRHPSWRWPRLYE